jgi:O-antigen/teichoic acid export membrane protein
VNDRARRGAFARRFISAIGMQALVSAANLFVGLILIRNTSKSEYGYYVLTTTVVILVTSLQNAFVQSHMVVRMTVSDVAGRADLIGGLYRSQRALLPFIVAGGMLLAWLAWMFDVIALHTFWIGLAAMLAVTAALFREFFRMVLLAHRRPDAVLRSDIVYCTLLVVFAYIAIYSEAPAGIAILGMALASLIGGLVCSTALWHFEPWNIGGARGILMEIAPLGAWTAAGALIHWLFSQGYNFLVAHVIDAAAVAAIAATRILVQPVNLLSTGIGTMMLPTVSNWLQYHGARAVMHRQFGIAGSLAAGALCYFGVVWVFRDWVFTNILKTSLADRDELMILWFSVGLLMLLRDQLVFLLLSRQRFRILTVLTAISAAVSLTTSYMSMPHLGAAGALLGVLVGEVINVGGLVILSIGESQKKPPDAQRPILATG